MSKLTVIVIVSLAAGVSAATWLMVVAGNGDPAKVAASDAHQRAGDEAGVLERVRALEYALRDEREARQLLEDELVSIYEALDSLERAQGVDLTAPGGAEGPQSRRVIQDAPAIRRENEMQRRQALVDAGFSEPRADWIMRRESELRMQAMQARYDALRSSEPRVGMDWFSTQDRLRDEIGDAEYEMYLRGSNRPTSIGVGDVLQASPAHSAGLQPGDRITHYDGERVYSIADLRRAQTDGEPGQNVVVNFVRDGTPMQVMLPRGPLGISASRGP